MDPNCPQCRGEGWVCEAHPHMPWLDGKECCGEPAVPCSCNSEGVNPPGLEVICETDPPPYTEACQRPRTPLTCSKPT